VYALPQSPQQLKQLLMVAGIDRYFQIARCFRDEDLRGDRQPEFTQLDLEMSFVDEAAVMAFIEHMVIEVSRATAPDRPIREIPFPVFEYDDAMERFGSDKPDVRFDMELFDLAPALRGADGSPASGFRVFDEALASGGRVKGITVPGQGGISRREIDELTELAKRFGARGLVHLSVEAGGELHGPVAKFLSAATQTAVRDVARAAEGDLVLVVADRGEVVNDVLGRLRVELGGGSVRIWQHDLLARSFNLQGYTLDQMKERFGAMLEAFEYGAPPHGGIALGIDRWAALLSYQTNIREVMAFPKTQSGSDLMLEAPSEPDEGQYAELGLRFVGVPGRA
jgi:aspartyl-tRNA synthetase